MQAARQPASGNAVQHVCTGNLQLKCSDVPEDGTYINNHKTAAHGTHLVNCIWQLLLLQYLACVAIQHEQGGAAPLAACTDDSQLRRMCEIMESPPNSQELPGAAAAGCSCGCCGSPEDAAVPRMQAEDFAAVCQQYDELTEAVGITEGKVVVTAAAKAAAA
jgi:hypothetical protein